VANAPSGFGLTKATASFELILRAPGFEDLKKTVIPDMNREYDIVLVREKKKRDTKRTSKKSTGSGRSTKASANLPGLDPTGLPKKKPRKPPTKTATPKKTLKQDDLIDPFAG
jgi:hypothetical protein